MNKEGRIDASLFLCNSSSNQNCTSMSMIGLPDITDRKLLKAIQRKHPGGIYSKKDFLKQLKSGDRYFAIGALEARIGGIVGPYTLLSVTKGKRGSRPEYQSSYVGPKPPFSKKDGGSVRDLFGWSKAVFRTRGEAEIYRNEIKDHEDRLVGMI